MIRPAAGPAGGIDLHLHTTASDGRCTPPQLVARAAEAGLSVIAVTDHDTVAAVREVQALASARQLAVVPGIEITAIERGQDVHVLGYFVHVDDPDLQRFLAAQRASRVARVEQIGMRLAELGMPIDTGRLLEEFRSSTRSIGRPQVARAMVDAGHVSTMRDAFERWLGRDAPAFVPRRGADVETVIAVIHQARGLASLAHPGRTGIDDRIPALAGAGLDALEVYHSDHDEHAVAGYARTADACGLLRTGGSDFHGDPARLLAPGSAMLPLPDWERLDAARHRHARH